MNNLKLTLTYGIIDSYKRLSYKQWYALAEYVDNSTQAYFNNKLLMDETFLEEKNQLTVNISYQKVGHDAIIKIDDNSIGMSYDELIKAVTIGTPPAISNGRSKYGLGMKTASFWLGDDWTIITKKLNEKVEYTVDINADNAIQNNGEISIRENYDVNLKDHYTKIRISNLNQPFSSRTKGKVKNYLRSMYRYDIHNKVLKLIWQGEELTWDYQEIFSKLLLMADGKDKVILDFTIGGKKVEGWAGVVEEGSRGRAGFSILQNERVIRGWPSAYKPESIFGEEGGRNDLINQRVVGELSMNNFTVSHTKDDIIYENDEEDILEFELKERLGNVLALALQPKKSRVVTIADSTRNLEEYNKALAYLESELNSSEFKDAFETFEVPNEEDITINNLILITNVAKNNEPTFEVQLASLTVFVYLIDDISPYDPYLSLAFYSTTNKLDVLINKMHPHWKELTQSEAILNFIKHCVYDGVSEWKAYNKTGEIKPDTVKIIKDNLLRSTFNFLNQ